MSILKFLGFALAPIALAQTIDTRLYSDMHWRSIGPPRAGRARALSGVPSQPNVFYIGFDNGGVWRSTDFGSTWTPLFDNQPTGSIGAIAVAPTDPNIIYVGSGAGIIRPDLATGDGMYKSTDAGKTWTHLGLRDSLMIANIEVDPTNANRLFVAALGHPYGPNPERGIFRSTNGGQTFEKVLYKDEYTSGNDVRIDPKNPNIVYAALWQQQQGFTENGAFGGTDGGIFKSIDGGSTWKQLTTGLPPINQANLAISPSNPKTLYATVAPGALPAPAGGRGAAGGRGGDTLRPQQVDAAAAEAADQASPSTKLSTAATTGSSPPTILAFLKWAPRGIRPIRGPSAASAEATFPPSPSTRPTKTSCIAAPPFSGVPKTAAKRGRPCAALPAATIIRRAGSIRIIRRLSCWSAIRAPSSPPIAARRGATGTPSPPPPCIT